MVDGAVLPRTELCSSARSSLQPHCSRPAPAADSGSAFRLRRSPAAPAATHFAIFVTADVRGQIAPCGCSEAMRGGLGKTAAIVGKTRASGFPALFVDAGDALFERTGFGADEAVGERRRAQAIADAFRAMRIDAQFAGPLDDALGTDFRRSLGLPELGPGQSRLLDAGGWKVGVVSGTTAAELTEGAMTLRAGGARFVLGLLRRRAGRGPLGAGASTWSSPPRRRRPSARSGRTDGCSGARSPSRRSRAAGAPCSAST